NPQSWRTGAGVCFPGIRPADKKCRHDGASAGAVRPRGSAGATARRCRGGVVADAEATDAALQPAPGAEAVETLAEFLLPAITICHVNKILSGGKYADRNHQTPWSHRYCRLAGGDVCGPGRIALANPRRGATRCTRADRYLRQHEAEPPPKPAQACAGNAGTALPEGLARRGLAVRPGRRHAGALSGCIRQLA